MVYYMSSNKYLYILLMVTNVYLIYVNYIIVLRDLYVYTMVFYVWLLYQDELYNDVATIAPLLHESFMLFCRGITCKFPCEFGCAI